MWTLVRMTASLLALTAAAGDASARPATESDVAKLRKDVQDQRALLLAILKAEQKRNEMLMRYLLLNEPLPADVEPSAVDLPAAAGEAVPAEAAGGKEKDEGLAARPHKRAATTASVKGVVTLGGKTPSQAWVYVEDVAAAPAHGSLEIKQVDKQFDPRVAVVQTGTRLVFTNADSIFHNVFSTSAGNSFDLGSFRAGDPSKAVVAATPGIVEIFCNMHSRMSSTVLVVPSPLFVRTATDGSFELPNVPVGMRKIVAWAPDGKPSRTEVEVKPGGSDLRFALEAAPQKGHTNKFGQAYGSYDD